MQLPIMYQLKLNNNLKQAQKVSAQCSKTKLCNTIQKTVADHQHCFALYEQLLSIVTASCFLVLKPASVVFAAAFVFAETISALAFCIPVPVVAFGAAIPPSLVPSLTPFLKPSNPVGQLYSFCFFFLVSLRPPHHLLFDFLFPRFSWLGF